MICGAPNDRLLEDGISTESYYCGLQVGHDGAHKSSGYPAWTEEPLATRALKAMLPPDAAEVADLLEAVVGVPGGPTATEVKAAKKRAAAILRGEP